MSPTQDGTSAALPSAAERLAEFRSRTLDVLLLVALVASFVPMAALTPMLWRAGGWASLWMGWGGVLLLAVPTGLRRLPYRLRVWTLLGLGMGMFAIGIPHGVATAPLVNAAVCAVYAALLLGPRQGAALALLLILMLIASALLPPELLARLDVGAFPPSQGRPAVALGILPLFGAVAGIAILVRGLVGSYQETLSVLSVLNTSEKRFRGVFEASPDATALVSWPEARFVTVNHGFELLYGWGQEEVLGRTAVELGMLRQADQDLLRARLETVPALDGIETMVRRRDGAMISVQLTLRRGEIAGERMTLLITRDVSTQRRLEATVRQVQRVEAMGTLAGGIAHNFRNALGTILPNLEFCLSQAPDRLRAPLEDAKSAASSAVALATRLTRMSQRDPATQVAPIELRTVLADVVGICRSTFGARIGFRQEIEAEGLVLAGRGELHQVFLNLLLNARDAVETVGEPRIEVRLARSADGGKLVVRVIDNGRGMDAATLQRVGEPFFTTKLAGRGTGLGLSTAFASIRDAGGRITVESRPGEGTTFTVELPVHTGPGGSEPAAPLQPLRPDVRVLVVDDDSLLLEAVSRQLASLGLATEPFTDPVAALSRLRAAPNAFDLLLTDLDMPVLGGRELAAQVRRAAASLPILVLSGTQETRPIPEASGVLLKPASTSDLAAAIERCLGLGAPRPAS